MNRIYRMKFLGDDFSEVPKKPQDAPDIPPPRYWTTDHSRAILTHFA
jgi:hypothetical protein